ncbi:MAG: hypothetical protein ABSD20_20465 [Terriglobales bacterium]|jgi:hypothetical protein
MSNTLARVTYFLGWIVAAVAVLLRLIRVTAAGEDLAYRLAIQPRSLLVASGLLFLSCIATVAYKYDVECRLAPDHKRTRAA